MQCVQSIQPNVPAHTTCRHGLYNSMVHACTPIAMVRAVVSIGRLTAFYVVLVPMDYHINLVASLVN